MRNLIAGGLTFWSCREGFGLRHRMSLAAVVFLAMALISGRASAQTFTTLLSFSGTNGKYLGASPLGSLTLSGSTLYGMTKSGGSYGDGNIFSINTNGTGFTNLLSFYASFSGTNGSYPPGSLALNGSTLYGMTAGDGGVTGYGTIFSINTNGNGFQTLASFGTTVIGLSPQGSLTLNGSTLYGMSQGNSNIFSINTNGTGFHTLLTFSGTNGGSPVSSLILSGPTLYGMTAGGGANGAGNIFSIGTNGTGFQTLHSFSVGGTAGNWPQGSLTLNGSILYGMTTGGGVDNDGTIFSINTNGTGFQTLYTFSGTNGAMPYGDLTLSGSTLYGMTELGGSSGSGNIFSINTNGSGFHNLYSFNGTNGAKPHGDLTITSSATIALTGAGNATIISGGTTTLSTTLTNSATSSTLYGMTSAGGSSNNGTVFSLTVSGANNLNYTLTAAVLSGNATLGAITSGTGSLAPNSSQSCTVSATSANLGINTISLTASDPSSSNGSLSTTGTLTVLGHTAPTLSVSTGNNQTVIVGATGIVAGLSLSNGTLNQTGLASLDVNSLGALVTGSTGGKLVASGSTQPYTASLSTGTLGPQTQTFPMNVGDDHTLAGASSPTGLSTTATLTVWDHSNASLSSTATQTAQTMNFGNVLRGATIPSQNFTIYNRAANTTAAYTTNLKLTGLSTSGNTAFQTNLANFNGLTAVSGSNGNTFTASLNTGSYMTGSGTISMSASQLADDSSLPGAGKNNSGGMTITLDANVGNATTDKSNSQTSFGTALTAPVVQNVNYANLESMATATTGSGGYNLVGSTATILAGTNLSGSAQTVSMAWRTQTQAERNGPGLISDVVDLSGMALSGSSGQTSTFVLQMNYNPILLPGGAGNEGLWASNEWLYLGWLDPHTDTWENAVLGNYGSSNDTFVGIGAWNGDTTLGDWGVNTANDTVWAVVNHNSEFAVVPEPSALVLLAVGASGLYGSILWRRRAAKRTSFDESESTDDAPAILAFRASAAHQSNLARRAA